MEKKEEDTSKENERVEDGDGVDDVGIDIDISSSDDVDNGPERIKNVKNHVQDNVETEEDDENREELLDDSDDERSIETEALTRMTVQEKYDSLFQLLEQQKQEQEIDSYTFFQLSKNSKSNSQRKSHLS